MFSALTSEAQNLLKKAFHVDDAPLTWEKTTDAAHGDITTTIALRLAKTLGLSPRAIAEKLAEGLKGLSSVENVEVAGAGYVNVWLTPKALLLELKLSRAACTPAVMRKEEKPVIIDYSSPNIAKPLGVHHILSTMIGQVVGNFYEHAGIPVVRWNYLGDWGTQYGKLAVAYDKWGKGKDPKTLSLDEMLSLYVKFHDEAEQDSSLETQAQEAFRKLEMGDAALRALWSAFVEVTKKANAVVYKRLHVHFDTDVGESYYEDKMSPIVEEGRKKGVFTSGEKGALIVEFPEESNMPPAVVMKGDGATLYFTRDLALMKDRIDRYHPQSILWAVDVAQQLYFQQLFAGVAKMGWELPHLEHMIFGRMRFADASMSTRKGNILKLEEVLDEAVKRASALIEERGDAIQTDDPKKLAESMGIGALVYGILSQNRKMDIVFDWDKMLSFEGNSAPYLQYTHARARSVLRKAEMSDEAEMPDVSSVNAHERSLVQMLLMFPKALEEARTEHLPHKLANFLYALSQEYNAFYNSEQILKAQEPERSLRLALTDMTASVLKTGANLLTIRVPDRM